MADITRYPFARHLRGTATLHVQHVRHGKVRHAGTGLSFWFRPLSAVLSEVPVADRELPMLFHARTISQPTIGTPTQKPITPTIASVRVPHISTTPTAATNSTSAATRKNPPTGK